MRFNGKIKSQNLNATSMTLPEMEAIMTTQTHPQNIVETQSGLIAGRSKFGALLFCGIPYAEPPVGLRRFKAASEIEPWSGIKDATRFGPAAPQIPSGGMTDSAPVAWNEDCLTLNVMTPSTEGAPRPILVWIHGGAYRSGQGAIPWYNGVSFATRGDIVVVTINYRLGALGFTDLSQFGPGFETSGVNGLLDQIKALEWVQTNIRQFGGDPARVTIAGESAGGFSVTSLVGSPRASGLFHRAIPQSGAAHHTLTSSQGRRVAELLMSHSESDSVDALMNCSVETLLAAQDKASAEYHKEGHSPGVQAFYPVEGNEVIPTTLLGAIASGVGKEIPMLLGTNKDEASLFIWETMSEEDVIKQCDQYGDRTLFANYRSMYPEMSVTEIAIQLSTDFSFKIPAVRLAEMREATESETFLYQFNWESRAPHLKSTHALEIPFVFNVLDAPGVAAFVGRGDLPYELADEMHRVWTQFIQGDSAGWSSYSASDRIAMHFDTESALVSADHAAAIKLWEGLR